MHPDESSECIYVRFFNLHLHPDGFVNKMTKMFFFMFRRKNSIFTVNMFLWVWRKIRFCDFGGKIRCAVLAENVFLTKN